jgi:hypothetical protein
MAQVDKHITEDEYYLKKINDIHNCKHRCVHYAFVKYKEENLYNIYFHILSFEYIGFKIFVKRIKADWSR